MTSKLTWRIGLQTPELETHAWLDRMDRIKLFANSGKVSLETARDVLNGAYDRTGYFRDLLEDIQQFACFEPFDGESGYSLGQPESIREDNLFYFIAIDPVGDDQWGALLALIRPSNEEGEGKA